MASVKENTMKSGRDTGMAATGSTKFKSTMQTRAGETQKSDVKVEDSLKEQMAEMSVGFEDIVKAREEAKKRLQERFDEVYNKITLNKKHVENQSEQIHTILGNFQEEFDQNLSNLHENMSESIAVESQFMQQEMDLANQRCGELEVMLEKETADRLKDTRDVLDPVRAEIASLKKELDFEIKYTAKMEKTLLKDVAQNIDQQHNVILDEKKERTERLNDIYDMLIQDVELQNKFFDQFEEKAKAEFNKAIEDIDEEVDSRLAHQENILKDLKFFVEKFGETMKIIGSDV
jgi:hypothetical protein